MIIHLTYIAKYIAKLFTFIMFLLVQDSFLTVWASTTFDEDFSKATLNSDWQVISYPGPFPRARGENTPANHYLLTDNPGFLRYYLDPWTYRSGFTKNYQRLYAGAFGPWDFGLEIFRVFEGESWVLEAKVNTYMPPPASSAADLDINIYFGDGGPNTYVARVMRYKDSFWRSDYIHAAFLKRDGYLDGRSTDIPGQPIGVTAYIKISRAGTLVQIEYSLDGLKWEKSSYDFGPGIRGLPQRVTIAGAGDIPNGAYADWDYIRLISGSADDHGNSIDQATKVAVDSRTAGRIDYRGDNDFFRLQVGTAGTLTVYTLGTTDTYGYLLDRQGRELARNDDASATNRNFRITRSLPPGTYFVRARHYSPSGTGAYTLVAEFTAANGKAQRAVLLLHGMNSAPDTWNTLVSNRWSGKCEEIYAGLASPPSAALPRDSLGAACYRLRFGRYDRTGVTGLENQRCTNDKTYGCSGDFTNIYAPTGYDLGVEVFAAVRAILWRLGSDTQVVLLGHSRGGLAARAFLQRPVNSAERRAVVGLVTTGTPHRGSPLGRIYPYLGTYCLDGNGKRINSGNKAGKPMAVWSACEDDWEAVDFLRTRETPLDLRMPTIKFLASGSPQIESLNSATSLANLPLGLRMVQLRYKGQYLGHITRGYSAWDHLGPQGGEQFSRRSRGYVLCPATPSNCNLTEKAPQFDGDGIVPSSSQNIGVAGRPNIPVEGQAGTYHVTIPKDYGGLVGGTIGEPDRVQDINKALGHVEAWK